ncbi:MAG TPA: D-alanyl-D-alanine carboxypeptidase/D-alanyl-D-alanine-endopeptidase [Deltaproteobacteria bacterium]|jgi:D-alanyl-D-alanine carboxypeptidase/D-alanyl-D-alanine-endopeptidase (penicillin-binding protein 4)|nr:D-alanyl-D-alanine carboxypeptidase/D-alanyl-D-alanine-endopeptidase [Deltaproteobacteria bacterium]
MWRRLSSALLAGLALACAPAGRAAGPPRTGGTEAQDAGLEAALAVPALRGAQIAALVVNAADGGLRFERDPDRPLVPASNLKLLTAVAALATLGPSYRFVTRILADSPPDAAGQVGTLYVRGGGDPALASEDWWRLAADLRRAGVRGARRLVVDDSAFDRERWHPSWGPVSSRAYFAPIGALMANYGAFLVDVRPGAREGDPGGVSVDPPVAYLRLVNRTTTGPVGSAFEVQVERSQGDGEEPVLVSGRVPLGGAVQSFRRSVLDPTAYAAAVLVMALEANDIRVLEPPQAASVPAGAVELLTFEGRSLGEIVRLMLKYSSNPIAETLTKALSAARGEDPAGWAGGVAASRAALVGLGVEVGGLEMVDGSGLSYENRVSPRTLVSVLGVARRSFAFGPELLVALPIAGSDGTLRDRAQEVRGEVRAKSGLLTRVVALSGEARMRAGGDVVFSILVNGYRCSDEEAMRALDGFVAVLVEEQPH